MQMNTKLPKSLLAAAVLALASLACSALSSLGSSALLQDNFESKAQNWGVLSDDKSSIQYSDGGLHMKVFKENYFIWSTPASEDLSNIHIEVTVKTNATDPTTAVGIICDQQVVNDSFYYFAAAPDG